MSRGIVTCASVEAQHKAKKEADKARRAINKQYRDMMQKIECLRFLAHQAIVAGKYDSAFSAKIDALTTELKTLTQEESQ